MTGSSLDRAEAPPGQWHGDSPDHLDVCDQCGLSTTDIDAGFCPSLHGMGCECGGDYRRLAAEPSGR